MRGAIPQDSPPSIRFGGGACDHHEKPDDHQWTGKTWKLMPASYLYLWTNIIFSSGAAQVALYSSNPDHSSWVFFCSCTSVAPTGAEVNTSTPALRYFALQRQVDLPCARAASATLPVFAGSLWLPSTGPTGTSLLLCKLRQHCQGRPGAGEGQWTDGSRLGGDDCAAALQNSQPQQNRC